MELIYISQVQVGIFISLWIIIVARYNNITNIGIILQKWLINLLKIENKQIIYLTTKKL